ncbi:GIY-YIG nuclease family protein [Echinicola vietnamensis]|uniref:Putative endonuclease containing a URI domain n=1 Tax=Echinicola vietnamensis (strain DSM 17526 / LMG 23754 / KMM 6221) TaxID=926556 RepID=L0G4X6_ECHVK|nr:GIY-YIG nuclease family protein [Echinicola vietnamensis]AGA80587.1 putative endonuclease containing a URI domain [Echinicola vietnamensis DSM 17526]
MVKPLGTHNYFVYILTNKNKTVLYTGVTNDLRNRLYQHANPEKKTSFTSKYNCFYLIYWERFPVVSEAIQREREIKGWRREKKVKLINDHNPKWKFLNDEI